jgi:ammonium transporter, Amt family
VNPTGAFFIGIIGAGAAIIGLEVLEYLRIDDPIGAVPVHMFAGMAGTMSLGLFGAGRFGLPTPVGADATTALVGSSSSTVDGLFYGGGWHLLWVQTYGTFTVAAAVFAVSMVLMYGVKMTRTLRVSDEGLQEGLDLHEHGVVAYPEFVVNRGFGGYQDMPAVVDGAMPVRVPAQTTAPPR